MPGDAEQDEHCDDHHGVETSYCGQTDSRSDAEHNSGGGPGDLLGTETLNRGVRAQALQSAAHSGIRCQPFTQPAGGLADDCADEPAQSSGVRR